jgi:hypothetical protein
VLVSSKEDTRVNRVVSGMDPHKRSVTIEVMAPDETALDGGRYATDRVGYAAMLRDARQWPDRVWAVEGCSGIGRHVATRLLADGEQVVDVPPKLSARARVFSTGQGRKTDATDAHSVALVDDAQQPLLLDAGLITTGGCHPLLAGGPSFYRRSQPPSLRCLPSPAALRALVDVLDERACRARSGLTHGPRSARSDHVPNASPHRLPGPR